ncbi:MAG: glycosyltransferase, partial [Arenicellales bacterium]
MRDQKIAVLIPCLNEARTIGKVVSDFQRELPSAEIYVFDNGSTDETGSIAADQGAIVRRVPRRGKGRAVRAMQCAVACGCVGAGVGVVISLVSIA